MLSRPQLTTLPRRALTHGPARLNIVALIAILAAAGCREPIVALGGTPPANPARARAEQMFAALGARMSDPLRSTKYDSARVRLVSSAFLPSRVWGDTSVWTAIYPSVRTLMVRGRFVNQRYRMDADPGVALPGAPADSRHVINLTRLSSSEYAWDTDVAYAIGSVTARDVGRAIGALMAGAEGRGELEMRADYTAALPSATAALGRLFTVDSVRTSHPSDGSTLALWSFTMRPDGIESRYPNFAKYLRRYVATGRARMSLTDRAGGTFFQASVADGRLVVRLRTLDGTMVPLAGSARPMPDSLMLNGELAIKVRAFTVGFHDYHADFTIIRSEHERAWSIVSRLEPEWDLPLITERLLRTPLRRPFQGSGASFRIGVRDSVGEQTLLHRRLHLVVQESAILRFIGRLGAIAVADYTGVAEREEAAFLREVFDAIVADVRGLQ